MLLVAAAIPKSWSASPVAFLSPGGSGLLFLREKAWSSEGAVSAPIKPLLYAAIVNRGKRWLKEAYRGPGSCKTEGQAVKIEVGGE